LWLLIKSGAAPSSSEAGEWGEGDMGGRGIWGGGGVHHVSFHVTAHIFGLGLGFF